MSSVQPAISGAIKASWNKLGFLMLGRTKMRILMHRKIQMGILMLVNTKLRFFMLGKTEMWRQGRLLQL